MTQSRTEAIQIGIAESVIEWHPDLNEFVRAAHPDALKAYLFYDAYGRQLNGKHKLPTTKPLPFVAAIRQTVRFGLETAKQNPAKLDSALVDTSETREQFFVTLVELLLEDTPEQAFATLKRQLHPPHDDDQPLRAGPSRLVAEPDRPDRRGCSALCRFWGCCKH